MKASLVVSLVFCIILAACQDSNPVEDKWIELRAQLIGRSEAAKNLAAVAMDSKHASQSSIKSVQAFSAAIGQTLRIDGQPRKLMITRIAQASDSLELHLLQLVDSLEADKDFRLLKSYAYFKGKLQSATNKLKVLIVEYNSACRTAGKNELMFPSDKIPQVSFD